MRNLSSAAIEGLRVLGADPDAIVLALIGHRSLDGAPGVDRVVLHERGFTDHEIEAAMAALPVATSLRDAFSLAIVGEGFVRDVLGASAEGRCRIRISTCWPSPASRLQQIEATATSRPRRTTLAAHATWPPRSRRYWPVADRSASKRAAMAMSAACEGASPMRRDTLSR